MIGFLVIAGVMGVVLIALALQKRVPGLRRLAGGLAISYFSVIVLLIVGEGYFRFVHADTEGRLASNNWIDRFWRVNTAGYRDREWTDDDLEGKTTVALLGDSFTAGWGIPDPAQRYGDVLAARLGDDYAVINVGVPGSSTAEQTLTLQNSPVEPDIVILQYFLNDIEYTLLRMGLNAPNPPTAPLVAESYLANYLDARVTAGFGPNYWQTLYAAYDNFAVWEAHAQEIAEFVAQVDAQDARLIVVIFPNMLDPVASIPYVDRVASAFADQGATEILKLFDDVAAWPLNERIVSLRDSHPSAAFHAHVADRLYALFFAPTILESTLYLESGVFH